MKIMIDIDPAAPAAQTRVPDDAKVNPSQLPVLPPDAAAPTALDAGAYRGPLQPHVDVLSTFLPDALSAGAQDAGSYRA